MNVDIELLSQLRLMRGCVDSALSIADAIEDTLLAALFSDIQYTLSDRIAVLVSAEPSAARVFASTRPL